ncbi:MAG: LytTR family transcriptional regulator DNA-binding domain-containing protein, partial [Lachnoclostridium sp.]|nr:LytTR family transcriptional regulator DNA-binding domain-containing protein [Lachnoclostridium sp.]
EQLLKTIYSLKASRDKITVSKGEKLLQLPPSEIYYFDAVDNRVYAYTQKEVYETKLKLYELEERLRHTDFFRASKSTIINLSKVQNFSPGFNGRFEVCLKNEEKLIVSRQYVPVLKEKLGL